MKYSHWSVIIIFPSVIGNQLRPFLISSWSKKYQMCKHILNSMLCSWHVYFNSRSICRTFAVILSSHIVYVLTKDDANAFAANEIPGSDSIGWEGWTNKSKRNIRPSPWNEWWFNSRRIAESILAISILQHWFKIPKLFKCIIVSWIVERVRNSDASITSKSQNEDEVEGWGRGSVVYSVCALGLGQTKWSMQ